MNRAVNAQKYQTITNLHDSIEETRIAKVSETLNDTHTNELDNLTFGNCKCNIPSIYYTMNQ